MEIESTPRWVPFLFGLVALLMGALILGAAIGVVPADPEGFQAPQLAMTHVAMLIITWLAHR